jgi:hypothetical protein
MKYGSSQLCYPLACIVLAVFLAMGARAEDEKPEARLVNGRSLPGKVIEGTAAGLKIETAEGEQTLPWKNLSAGTRYRYEPGYKERFNPAPKKPQEKAK